LLVVDVRASSDAIRRRLECKSCGERMTSHERIEQPIVMSDRQLLAELATRLGARL